MGPGRPPGARIMPVAAFSRRLPSAAIRPVHAEHVAALVALHVLRLSGDVLALVAPRADEVGLVDDAPELGAVLTNLQVVPRHTHFHLMDVHADPGLAAVLHDPIPAAAAQTLLLSTVTLAPHPTQLGHGLLQFLGGPFPHEHEDCRLRDHEIALTFECDLHRRLPKEERVVADPCLHREVLDVGAVDLPGLVVHAGRFRHRGARPGGDNAAALHLATLQCGRGQVQADVGALLPLFRGDEDAVAHDDQALGGFVRHGRQYTTFPFRWARRLGSHGATASRPPRTAGGW